MPPRAVLSVVHQSDSSEPEISVDYEGLPPLLPDGIYEARYLGHATAYVFSTPKVFLRFEIIQPGDHFGAKLFAAYRVKALVGKAGPNGRLKVSRGGELLRMLSRVFEIKTRPDRISLVDLRACVLRVQVRTVTQDYRQRELPTWRRYSKVSDVIEKETGYS